MKNSVADRANAQVSCAAHFIGNHIESFVEVTSQQVIVLMIGLEG
mgnify:CR=1 FL=1